MKTLTHTLFFCRSQALLVLMALCFATYAMADTYTLSVGQSLQLPISGESAIRLTGRKIIQVDDLGHELKITAQQPGAATVKIENVEHHIQVVAKTKNASTLALEGLLKEFLDLQMKNENGQIRIVGQLHRLRDWQDIYNWAKDNQSNYLFQAQVDEDIRSDVKKWIDTAAEAAQLPRPHIVWSPFPQLILSEEDRIQQEAWSLAMRPLGLTVQFQKSQLGLEPLVRIKIVVAEVNKKMQSQIGIDWPDQAEAKITPRFTGATSLSVFLKALEQKGLAQILASPNLLARSGSEAEFLAGGEFPIKIITAQRREVVWKRHGIFLKMKPKADRTGRMSIELSTEISLVDQSQAIEGVPGMKTNRTSTHFDLSSSQTIVLSGLIRQDWGESTEGVMGLSRLPILGGLFRSESFQNNKTELVIFVTPEIVSEQ